MKKSKETLEILVDELERQSASLLSQANKFSQAFDKLLEGVQIIDFNWHTIYANETLARYEDSTREKIQQSSLWERYPGLEDTDIFRTLQRCMVNRTGEQTETEFQYPDQSKKWFELSIEPIEEGLLILSLDVTKRKQAEEKINNANHLLAFLSQVNQNIVRVKDEATLFRNACRMAIEFGKFKVAWIGLIDKDNKRITLAEQSGIPPEEIKSFTDVPFQDEGPQFYVMQTGKYYICNDIERDLELADLKLYAARHSICSCIVLPISKSGRIIGTFNLYSTQLDFLAKAETDLLVELTSDISFALDLFEKAEKHRITEEMLAKNEVRFRSLIEKSTDMISLVTAEGELTYTSPAVTEILGYTTAELLRKPDAEFIHPDDLSSFKSEIATIAKTPGASFSNEQRILHKNGTWMWCAGTVTNLLHVPGVHAIVSNFRDISGRKSMEQQQEFYSNNLDALINSTGDLMWSVGTDYKLIMFNRPLRDIIKLSSGKDLVSGMDILSVALSEEQRGRFKSFYDRAFTGEEVIEIEYFSDPVESWAEITYYPIRSSQFIIGAACHSRDITNIKRAEQELNRSEALNRGILNSLNSHIAVVDEAGTIIAVNKIWEKFASKNGDAALLTTGVRANYFDVCEKSANNGIEAASDVLKALKDVMSKKRKRFYLEYPCHSPTERRWFSMNIIKFDSEKPMVVVSHQNITERKLAKEQLIVKNEELQKTNTELDRFVYSASHDLRAPLSSILGLISLVELESKEASTLNYASMMRDSVNRLDGFIKNILSYSKNNRLEINALHIPLKQTIDATVNSLRYMKEAEQVTFEINIKEEQPFYSDVHRFTIILENLISNSIKFQDFTRTERFIRITGTSTIDELVLEVADNGIGLPNEYQPKIFEMFFRISGERPGSGIGLYIVKETITKLGGTITVVSHEHTGTTFTVRLKNLIAKNFPVDQSS